MAKKKAEAFVVGSKVREFVKKKNCFASADLLEGLNRQVALLLAKGVERAKANNRKTVRSQDV
jgi:hypothetical protein